MTDFMPSLKYVHQKEWMNSIPHDATLNAGLFSNSYNMFLGSVLEVCLAPMGGGGRLNTTYGMESKIIFDWPYMLGKILPDIPKLGGALAFVFGQGFNTGGVHNFVLGPCLNMNYYGFDFAVRREREKVEVNYARGGEGAFQDYMINISSVPPAIMTIISLGCLVILGLVVSMRVIFARSSAITLETRIISGLIPFFEILWLGILVMVEKLQSIAEMLSELAKSFGEGVQSAKAKATSLLSNAASYTQSAVAAVASAAALAATFLQQAFSGEDAGEQLTNNLKVDTFAVGTYVSLADLIAK